MPPNKHEEDFRQILNLLESSKVWILLEVTSERWTSDQLSIFVITFGVGLLLHLLHPIKSDDKYAQKVFNWSEVHLSEVTLGHIHRFKYFSWN